MSKRFGTTFLAAALGSAALVPWLLRRTLAPGSARAASEVSAQSGGPVARGAPELDSPAALPFARERDRPARTPARADGVDSDTWLRGRVLLSCGAPLAHHALSFSVGEELDPLGSRGVPFETDADGAFRFPCPEAQAQSGWLASISQPSFTESPLFVRWSETSAVGWILPGSLVDLEVLLPDGTPAAGAEVRIYIEDRGRAWTRTDSARADAGGKARFLTHHQGALSARASDLERGLTTQKTALGALGPDTWERAVLTLPDLESLGALRVVVTSGGRQLESFALELSAGGGFARRVDASDVAHGILRGVPRGTVFVELVEALAEPPSLYVPPRRNVVEVLVGTAGMPEAQFEVELRARALLDLGAFESRSGLAVSARRADRSEAEPATPLAPLLERGEDSSELESTYTVLAGRSYYTPLFAAGEWEFQLEDRGSGQPLARARAHLTCGEIARVVF